MSDFKDAIKEKYQKNGGTTRANGWKFWDRVADTPEKGQTPTTEQLRNKGILDKAVKESLPTLRNEILGAGEGNRFATLKEEISFIPNADKILDATDKFGPQFQESFASAIGENPAFANYLVEKLESGEATFVDGLNSIDPKYAKQLTQITNTIATAGQNGTSYDFNNLDTLVEDAKKHAELLSKRAAKLKLDPNADVSAEDKAIESATTGLMGSARDAGAKIPNMDGALMLGFMGDLFDPNISAEQAINKLGGALNMSPEELAALQNTLGPIMGIMETLLEPYAELYQKYKDPTIAGVKGYINDVETVTSALNGQTYSPSAVDQASTVAAIDDTQFSAAVKGDLSGSSPVTITKIFDTMRNNADPSALDEINALEEAIKNGDAGLSNTFGRMVTLDVEKLTEAINDGVNEMEKGATPRAAFTM